MRCASPPDKVDVNRSSIRYSKPTSFRKRKRERISSRSFSAISASSGRSAKPDSGWEVAPVLALPLLTRESGEVTSESKNTPASSTVIEQTSQIFLPAILTCCASRRKRAPPHSEHVEYPR